MYILIINSGSSSLKYKLFDFKLKTITSGLVEKIGLTGSFIDAEDKKKFFSCKNHEQALTKVLETLEAKKINLKEIKKIGHRVVHGGEEFVKPLLITKTTLKKLEKYNELAPLHNPNNIAGIKSCLKLLPQIKNFAAFDTSFYQNLPEHVYKYPVPEKLYKKYQIRKYGFHGISHQYIAGEFALKVKKKLSKLNLITCHLGSGCSITAIKNGQAVDTSMGFTPLEGLMMSSRCGDIDPAIPLFLVNKGLSSFEIDKMLNFQSGLVGVSGFKDMRDIMVASGYKIPGYKAGKFTQKQKENSKLALNMFVYRVQKYIGAYSAILGNIDAVIFTAGIGERNKDIRNLIMKNLKHKSLAIPTNEELMIAREII